MKNSFENYVQNETRDKIFKVAVELIAKKGYDKVSVREICEKSGVTKPTLYYYFKDKYSIISTMLDETEKISEYLKKKYVDPNADFISTINSIFYIYRDFIRHHSTFLRFSAFINSLAFPPEIIERKIEHSKKNLKEFENLFKRGQQEGMIKPDADINLLVYTFVGPLTFIILQFIFESISEKETIKKIEKLINLWIEINIIKKEIKGAGNE